ncbi:hypothetical protein C8F04DRAFT_1226759 [Mycena alexandri]|uniref:Uncharacterized protein n=1 Tax=Mycena alexandri TaxID=1745969 RepID=A0AAD6TK50_9AGAR|nr:hypothetical protein C8F04DRAFT_1226759 [Mycena alexandri]
MSPPPSTPSHPRRILAFSPCTEFHPPSPLPSWYTSRSSVPLPPCPRSLDSFATAVCVVHLLLLTLLRSSSRLVWIAKVPPASSLNTSLLKTIGPPSSLFAVVAAVDIFKTVRSRPQRDTVKPSSLPRPQARCSRPSARQARPFVVFKTSKLAQDLSGILSSRSSPQAPKAQVVPALKSFKPSRVVQALKSPSSPHVQATSSPQHSSRPQWETARPRATSPQAAVSPKTSVGNCSTFETQQVLNIPQGRRRPTSRPQDLSSAVVKASSRRHRRRLRARVIFKTIKLAQDLGGTVKPLKFQGLQENQALNFQDASESRPLWETAQESRRVKTFKTRASSPQAVAAPNASVGNCSRLKAPQDLKMRDPARKPADVKTPQDLKVKDTG